MEQQLRALDELGEGEVVLDTALSYRPDEPVRVRVRKSADRYDVDDDGNAVRLAGQPQGWREMAQGLMTAQGLSVDGHGAVHVPGVVGRDLGAVVLSVADTSLTLYSALAETDLVVDFDSDTSVE